MSEGLRNPTLIAGLLHDLPASFVLDSQGTSINYTEPAEKASFSFKFKDVADYRIRSTIEGRSKLTDMD
jgi:hypothetical protein